MKSTCLSYHRYQQQSARAAHAFSYVLIEELYERVHKIPRRHINTHFLSDILQRLTHIRDIASSFFFLQLFDTVSHIIKEMQSPEICLLSPYRQILYCTVLLREALRTVESDAFSETNESCIYKYLLFVRNKKRFLSRCSMYLTMDYNDFSAEQTPDRPRIHPATLGESNRYILFPHRNSHVVMLADTIEYRLRTVSARYIEASLTDTKQIIPHVYGFFRFKGNRYYALSR